MRKASVILLFAAIAAAAFASLALGQQKAASPKQARWEGTIVRIDNDASYMDVRNTSDQQKRIHWDSSTTWTKLNKPITDRSGFKPDERVICLGKYDAKGEFNATRIDLRLPK